jgi:hypothetical protein
VEFLVNHRSILWDDRAQEVALYHIELASHDVLVANGAPAESYRDDGNRWLFQNARDDAALPRHKPCAPILTGGRQVDQAWRWLLHRAGRRPGLPLTDDPDLHLMADGRRIDHDDNHVFRLSGRPGTVRIVSRAGVPQELGLARDARALGVALRRITVTNGTTVRTMDASDDRLVSGFHDFETVNGLRWTNGDAMLPSELIQDWSDGFEVVLHLGASTQYLHEGDALAA